MCKVSVIMPVYNTEEYVERAINSILGQTEKDFELIIVDDCSTDSSWNVVSKFVDSRIKLFRNDHNIGVAATRNYAIKQSSGKYIAIMDSDDLAPKYRLEREIKYLDENPKMVAVIGNACRIDENDLDLNELWKVCGSPYRNNAQFLFGNPIPNSSAMVRRSVLIDNNIEFKDNMYGLEDYRFWSEVSLVGLIGTVNELMLFYRIRAGSDCGKNNKDDIPRKRKIEFFNIRDLLFENYGILLDEKEKALFYEMYAEARTTATCTEIVKSLPIIFKMVWQTRHHKLGKHIAFVCFSSYIRTVVKSVKVFITGKNRMWWDFEERKSQKPEELDE